MATISSTNLIRRSLSLFKNARLCSCQFSTSADRSTDLKEVLSKKIPEHNKKVVEFRKQYGSTAVQQITVDMLYGGLRSVNSLVTETSTKDAEEGVRFRGYTMEECMKKLPHAKGGDQPLPEGVWWLLCTGDVPNEQQTTAISQEWAKRGAKLPDYVTEMLSKLPSSVHPMSQLVSAIAALSSESTFAKAYQSDVDKSTYWEYVYEDSMNLLAKLPTVAAVIYRNLYKQGAQVCAPDTGKDWSSNFSAMLGFNDPAFTELLRLYLTIHSDCEGGNVSAHACNLVGSTLADPYVSLSAAMAGLSGPLHGLTSERVLKFLIRLKGDLGEKYTHHDVRNWIWKRLFKGEVIPGYGNDTLPKTDPRYDCQRDFALKHMRDDEMFKLVEVVYKVTPDILVEQGEVKNPWPNMDAHSGILLQHYGLKEMSYYSVLYGVSRALGCLAQLIWARGMGLPMERPKSQTTDAFMKLAQQGGK